ncbi:phage late control D family protein [Streptomyces sp. NRRL F-5755]|uniref:phage late control D family protein n=1 Tax=Streptomyces sp. NRRL F-5755 TaxID=1519475 RepID=UPI001331447B|nr:contractile injection system protein, VgrG/Pvc8 family [Streptomyces sp. NRRL F-5755]
MTNEPDTLDHFGLTLANPAPELPWTHTRKAELFQEGNAVSIELGYVRDLQPMFDGEITSISPVFPETGTATVRVEGHTRLHWLRGSPRTRTFLDVTDSEIAEQIATDLGLTADVADTGTKHPYILQFNQTDLAFLTERARAIHFELTVRGRVLVLRRAGNDESRSHTLVWGQNLRGFTPTMNTLDQVGKVVVRGYDPATKKRISGESGAGAAAMGGSRTGADVAARAFGRRREETRTDVPVASQEEADQLARALYEERALRFVTGTGSSIGLPGLRAGRTVELCGLGPQFSGLYYLTRSTHTIDRGGYRTTFSVKRNAVG